MLVERGIRIAAASKSYSVNEGNRLTFPDGYQRYLDWAQDARLLAAATSARWSPTCTASC